MGCCPMPTPLGVPVRISAPGSSVQAAEMCSISRSIENSRSFVRASWRRSPFTQERSRRSSGLATSSAVVIHGPKGQKVSAPLARVHWPSRFCRSRPETSLATV